MRATTRTALEQAGFQVNRFEWTTEIENFGTGQNIFSRNEKEVVYRVTKPD